MSAGPQRLDVLHALADKVTVITANAAPMRAALELLKWDPSPLTDGQRLQLERALGGAEDIEEACRGSVVLFAELRDLCERTC